MVKQSVFGPDVQPDSTIRGGSESRFSTVTVQPGTKCVFFFFFFFKDMGGMSFGIWAPARKFTSGQSRRGNESTNLSGEGAPTITQGI